MDVNQLREVAPGGGLVTAFVSVSRLAKIDKDSTATGSAEILGRSQLLDQSIARDYAKTLDYATIRKSVLQGYVRVGGAAVVEGSILTGTVDVRGASRVINTTLRDNVMILENAEVENSNLGANTRVSENAKLYNVITGRGDNRDAFYIAGDVELAFPVPLELAPGTRITEGVWTRPPLVVPTPVFTTVEGAGDRVQIGCLNHSMVFWYKHGKEVLVNYGLDPKLYPQFEAAVDQIRDFKKLHKSPKIRRKRNEGDDL